MVKSGFTIDIAVGSGTCSNDTVFFDSALLTPIKER